MVVEDIRRGLAAVIGALWGLPNTVKRDRGLVYAYRTALDLFEVSHLAEQVQELERKIEELQAARQERGGSNGRGRDYHPHARREGQEWL